MILLAQGPNHPIRRFKCPGCNLVVQGTAYQIQLWADEHCFECFEERSRIHLLNGKGRVVDLS